VVEELILSRIEGVQIITSLDSPYAISDAIKQTIKKARKYLLISAPWLSKGFVDSMRDSVPEGSMINVLTKVPEKIDYSFRAIDSLLSVAQSKGWMVNVKCNPYIHAKLIIVDGLTCIFGSCNQTDSGIYYNHEAIEVCTNRSIVEKWSEFFNGVWELPENISFEQVKHFHGYKTIDKQYYRKEIAERIVGCFMKNGNSPFSKWKLCKEIQKMGYNENDVISVLRDLVNDGILYEPDSVRDSYRMVSG
jgi:phosphatidylserine/phosphatidylglycerophosphate/cardiolipin synthase-like enzyme